MSIDRQEGTSLAPLLPKPQPYRSPLRIASPDELQRLYAKAKPHLRLFLLLGVQLGLRFAEILAASPAGYNSEHHTLTVTTKGGRTRTFQLGAEIEQLFAIAPELDTGYVMRLRGGHCHRQTIREDWFKLLALAAIDPPLLPHALRRTAAVRIYREGKDVIEAQTFLGHSSLTTTAHYLRAYAAELQPLSAKPWTPTKGETIQ